jgi:autotransporter-associated beta strand protein
MKASPLFFMIILATLRRYRSFMGWFMICLMMTSQMGPSLQAATLYWDSDASATDNNALTGANLGGTGDWNSSALNWWNPLATLQAWDNSAFDMAVFTGAAGTVTLKAPMVAGGLTFNRNGYLLTSDVPASNTLTLTSPTGSASPVITVNNNGLGTNRATISALLAGSSGFTKAGNGALVLSGNNASLSGDIAIKGGSVVISNQNQLGSTTGTAISVTGISNTTGGTGTAGFTGGALVLQGTSNGASATTGSVTLNRELSISGRGPGANNLTGSLVSIGYNTLAGGLTVGAAPTESRLWATHGSTTISGGLSLGAGNTAIFQGNGNWIVSGQVTGADATADRFQKSGNLIGSTLWLQNNSNIFAQGLNIGSGTVRVSGNGALGINTALSSVTLSNATLEVRTDAPNFGTRNIQTNSNTTGTVFVDHGITGDLGIGSGQINQTVAFGALHTPVANTQGLNVNLAGRNGYNVSFTAATLGSGAAEGNVAINNNTSGTLTLNGNLLGANTSTSTRTTTIGGNGNSILTGNFIPGGTLNHNFTKSGSGILSIQGTAGTFTGATNVSGGTLNISSIGALNASSSGRVVFGGGALNYTGAGETWANKVLLLNSANGIVTNNGTGALVLSQNVGNNGTGTKTLVLGGSNTAVNDITGIIVGTTLGAGVTKIGSGTWQITAPGTATAQIGTANASYGVTAITASTAGTQTITTSNTAGLVVGQPVSGAGVAVGTVISQIISPTQFAVSQAVATTGLGAVGTSVNIGTVTGSTAALNVTASTTANLLTVASTANLVPGQYISGTGLAAADGWYVSQINSATTFTVANSTNTAALVLNAAVGTQNPLLSPNFGGTLTITNGTLRLNATAAGTGSDVVNNGSAITFQADAITGNGSAGGILDYRGFTGGSSETLGRLTVSAGNATVRITPVGGTNVLTFGSIAAPAIGSSLNFDVPGSPGTNSIVISKGTTAGLLNAHAYYNGADFAYSPGGLDATLRAPVYGTDATFTAVNTLTAATNVAINSNQATGGALAVTSLKISGDSALTLGGLLTVGGAAGGGVLVDGATTGPNGATISGTGITTGTAGDLAVRVNGASDILTLSAPITSTTTGGLTKNGAGTLILSGPNAQTGTTTINEGLIQLSGTGTLSGANRPLTIRQNGALDLNGVSTGTSIGALNGAGLITNTAASTPVTLTIGNGVVAATNSVFSGLIRNPNGGAGALTNVTVTGAPTGVLVVNQALTGLNDYTGITTISNTGAGRVILQANVLANGGSPSSIGASSNAASNLVFNGGTLQYTGSTAQIHQLEQTPSISIDREFTLAGNATIQSSGQYGNNVLGAGAANHAALIFNSTADLTFSGTGARTLTLGGTSIGDNQMRIRLRDNPNGGAALSFTKADGGLWILNPLTSNDYTGTTTVSGGALRVANAAAAVQGLSATSPLVLNGGVLETASSFTRTLGAAVAGTGNVSLTGGASGFAASTADRLVVTLGGGALTWGGATFNPTSLVLGSSTALGETEITNNIAIGAAVRTITTNNNGNTGTMVTAGILSGVISGAGTGGNALIKNGGGVLILGNANTYTGSTRVDAGNLIATSIGTGVSSSLGASGALIYNPGDADLNALIYVGSGETANRNLTLQASASFTANRSYRIDASGSGALVWNTGTFAHTTRGNDVARVLTLDLRGSNTDNNQMNLVLTNSTNATFGNVLNVTKSDGGTWILNPVSANSFTGAITAAGGNLGLTANGIGAASGITLSNGGIFAYGGPLSVTKNVTLGNNATSVFAGQNAMTFTGTVTLPGGNNDITLSNNLEGGALLTFNGNLVNLKANDRTLNIRGYGSTVWNGILANASANQTFINIALDPNASFTTSGAANTYTGTTTLTDGILILDKATNPLGTGPFAFNGGTLRVGSTPSNLIGASAISNAIQLNASPPKVDGAKSIEFSGAVTMAASRNLQNELTGGANLILSGTVTNTVASTLTIYGSGNTQITGNVTTGTGAQGLQLSGTGTLSLTGTNLATGALQATRSTITLSGTSGGSWNAGTTQVNPTGTLTLDNSGGNNAAGRLNDTGAFTGNGGTLNFINNGTSSTETTGALTLNNATTRITMSGAGSGTLTFASVTTPNTGSSLDLSTISGLGTTNQVIFTAAPTLANGINARIFVNGGADFATHTAGSIGAYTGYNNSNNLNTALATDTMDLTASAATTSNRTVNAIKLNGTGLAVTGAPSNRLTLTAAAILNTGGNNALSINEVAFAANTGLLQVASGTTLTVNSDLTGSAGISKFLAGDLTFGTSARSFITSTHNLFGGVTTLNGGADTLFPNQALTLNDTATLNLNGGGQYINTLSSTGALPGTGGTINGGGALVINNGGTFGGTITSGTSLGRVQGGTLAFQSAQSYTGTTLLMGGTTTFENDATLLNTSDISINHATLFLSNNSSLQTQNNNRVGDAIAISLRGGTISVTGRLSTAATETLGAVSALQGANTITATTGGGTITSMDLTLASLTRSTGATVNFTGTTLGQQGNSARIMVTSPLTTVGSGLLGAWAIANNTDYAAYNTGLGIGVVGQGGFTGYDGTFGTGNLTQIPATAATTTELTAGTTNTAVLRLAGAFTNNITFSAGSNILNLELGGLLRSDNNNATTIGTVASRGILTSGTPELVVYNNANTTGATAMTINSSIQGAGTALVKSGAGVLALTGVNTYDGGTTVTQGTLELRGTNTGDVVIPAGGLTLNNANVTQFVTAVTNPTGAGQVDPTNAVTLRGGSALTLTGNNTLSSLAFDNNGGTTNPTVTNPANGVLTLSNATPITVTSSNPSTVATIAGAINIGSGAKTINTPAIQVGGVTVTNIVPTLNISAAILSPGASINKTGNGLLQLSGQSTFTGGVNLNAGGLVIGASSTPAQGGGGITTGPLGSGTLSVAAGRTLLTSGTFGIGNDVTFAGTPLFDATANTAWTLSLNGTINGLANGASPIEIANPGMTVALLGTIPNIASITSFNKTGLGTLIFNSKGYTGNFDANALGNGLAVQLLHDGLTPNVGNGVVETIALPGNVIFAPVGTGTITVNRAGGSLPFNLAANKIISPASINTVLTNGLIVANTNGYGLQVADSGALVGTPAFTVNTATASNVTQGLYMAGALSGSGFVKTGPGTMVLGNAANSFIGNVNINQGVVSVSENGQLGNAGNLVLLNPQSGTATLRATDSFSTSRAIQLSNTTNLRAIEVVGGETLTLTSAFDLNAGAGAAASLIKADNGTLLIDASNPGWSGALNINAGAVLVNNNTLTSPLGTGAISISPGAAVVGAALQLAGGVNISNTLNIQGNNNLFLGGINTGGQLQSVSGNNTYSGTINFAFDGAIGADSGSTLNLTGPVVVTGTRRLGFMSAGDINISTGATFANTMFGMDKFGAGTLTISVPVAGAISGTGGFKVAGGTVVLNGTATTNSSGAPNLVYQGATLRLDNSGTNTNSRLTGRAVTLQGGTFDFISNNSTELAGAFVSDQGANTINNGGTGTSSLTFASYTGNAGSSLNVTGTFGTATNFVKFTAAPTLSPASTGILNRVTVNGNQLATYNATNGIVAFTGYSPATNILSAGATQAFNATPLTANSLTGNQTLNALTLSSAVGSVNVGGLSGLNPTTLTLTSGTILANGSGTTSALSVPVVAFAGAEAIIHVASGQTLNVTSGFSGTAGLSKNLPGTLNLDAQQFISGVTYVNGGTLNLQSSSTNTLLFNNAVAVNAGGTLDLNGSNQFIAGLSSASAVGSSGIGGGTVTNSAVGQSTFTVNGNTNFGGVISGNIYLNKTGTGALNLQAPQTYTGATLITGGTLTLNDNGTLPNTTQPIDIRYGTLSFANGNLTNNNNRVNDLAPINLSGGTLNYAGRAQMDTSESLGAVSLIQGHSSIFADDGNAGLGSAVLTLASLTQADPTATVRFNNLAEFGQIGTRGRVMITANPTLTNNIIGPWAIIDREYASYDATYGVGGLNAVGFAGYAGSGLNTNPLVTDNVRHTATGTTILSGNTVINTLNLNQTTSNMTLDLGGNTLRLQGGGLLIGQNTDSTSVTITNGTITSGTVGSPSDFFVTHAPFDNDSRPAAINAVIADNAPVTGPVRLILSAGDTRPVASGLTLGGVNTYTGGTVLNQSTIILGAAGALGTGGITVNAATLVQTAGGVIPAQALTMNGGSVVTLAGANSLTGLTFNNNGGTAPTLNPTGVLTLTGGITSNPTNPGTISTISNGTLDLNAAGSYSINVAATLVNGVDVAPWQAGLIINSVIDNGGIVKTGAGVLQLGGASTFAGGLTVNAGGLIIATDTNSLVLNDPVTTGPVGTGTLTMAANTTMLAGGAARTITNNVTFLGDSVFNGTNNLTLNGTTTLPAIWNAVVTAPQMTVTIGDASPSVGTDVINKSGLGILTVGNYAGTINASGGLLFSADGNTLGTPENVSLGGNLVITGDTAITVNRTGSGPNSRNKTLQKVDLTVPGNIMSVSNQSGYGLEFTGNTLMTGPSHFAVGVATVSNVVQGLILSGVVDDGASTFGIIKSGPGTLVLSGANTFGGVGQTIDILNGVVSVNSDAALGDAANTVTLNVDGSTGVGFRSTGTFSTGRTFNLNQANNAFEVTSGNVLTLTAPFVLSAATNTLTKNDNGVFAINADNTGWTGAITVNAGALRAGHANALGNGTITVNNAVGSSVQLTDGITFNSPIVIATTGASGYDSRGVIESVSGINTITGLITQNSGIGATIGAASGATLNINGAIATGNSTNFNAGAGATINLNSVYANGGAGGPTFNKIGTGALNVTVNQPAVAAAINVNQGALNVSGAGVTLGITGLITVNASGTLTIDDTAATAARLGNRAVTLQGGTFNYLGSTSTQTSNGALTFARMGGIYNQTASTSATVTFGSLAIGADASANFTGAGLGTATNRLMFNTAPTLVGGVVAATNGILARATFNGSTFATYNTNGTAVNTNGIQGFTGYNFTSATNINSAANTDTVDANAAMTTKNLTANRTINALRLSGGTAQTVGGAAFNQLTLTAGGILATGATTHVLSVPVLNNAAVQNVIHVNTGSTLNISSTIVGTGGIVKDGAGTLIISSPSTIAGIANVNGNTSTGNVTIARGTVQLAGGTNTLAPGQFLVMGGPAATLDLNGTSQQIAGLLTDTATPNSGGSIIGGAGSQLVINQDNVARTYAGTIGGSVNLVRSGQNTLSIASDNAYTGTTIINGATTTLRDDGALSGTSAISINYATLSLDNNAGLNGLDNRITDSAAITLRGGTINFQGRAQTASAETLGAVTLAQGGSTINSVIGGTGINSADLTLTSLNRAVGGGTVNFTAATGGLIGSSSRILIPTINGISTSTAFNALNDGILGGWAVIGTSDWASYVPGLGIGAMGQQGFPQYSNILTTPTTLANSAATDNVNLNTASITSLVNDDLTVNSLRFGNVASNTVNIAAGKTLTLESGGLLFFSTAVQTLGAAVNQGNLTSSGPELFVVAQGAGNHVINSVITGSNSLVKSGVNTLNLAGLNTYTGGTTVNQGTLNVLATSLIPLATVSANGLILNNGTVNLNAPGAIDSGNIVTINSAGSSLNLFGDNTLAGLVLNNNGGGNANLQVNTFSTASATGAGEFGVLTIGASGIEVTSSNVASTAIIVGRTDFGASANTVNVAPINANGLDVAPLQAAFALQGIVGTTGGINKTGNGVLQFNAQAHYSGPTTVTAGGIRSGVTFGGSRLSALTLNSGTHLNLNGATTVWGSLAGSGTVFNSSTTAATLTVGFDNTSTTFSGQLKRFNDAVVNGVALQKIGTGTLTMTAAQAFASGTTGAITVNGGALKYMDAGAAFQGTTGTGGSGGGTFSVNNGALLALDNSGSANVNNRLGLNAVGTLNLQGGKLTINGTSTAATPTSEQITTFTVNNGGGRIELTPNASNPLTLAITTLSGQNSAGSLVVTGITGAASANGVANLTITTPALIAGQGAGANGTATMSVRSDILADANVAGLGTGFLVRDSVTNNYRALGTSSAGVAVPGEFETAANTALLTNWGATENVKVASAQTLFANTPANTLTFEGTSSIASGLSAAFGNYGPGGSLLTQNLSNAAGLLVLEGATATVGTGALAGSAAGTTLNLHVVGTGTLGINGAFGIGNTGGIIKSDGGLLSFNNRAYYTGVTTINNGTLRLNSGAANTLAVVPTAGAATVSQVNLNGTGSVLDLMGRNQAIGALTSVNPLPGNGGTVQNTGAAAVLTTMGTGTFSGAITGNLALTRAGNSTTTLTNANTYTGATIVRGGVLELRDSGTLASTAGLTLNYGTLNWNNFGLNAAGSPNPTRIAATNAVTLQGGTFTINGAGSTDTVATLNSVTVTGGNNVINTLPYINMGSTVQLTIGNLVRNTATKSGVVFNGFSANNSTGANTLGGQGLTTNSNIFLTQLNGAAFSATNLVNNLIGGWAVADGNTFATYSNVFGVVAMGNVYGGFTAPAFTGTDLTSTVATGNYNDAGTGTTAITRTMTTGAKAANSWRIAQSGAATTITPVAGTTYSFGVGVITNNNQAVTIGAVNSSNTITGTGADLFFYINSNTTVVQPSIIGSAALISNGPATLSLRPQFASNTYSGGTFVNNGTTNLQAASGLIAIPGNLTITNGAVTMNTTPNQIAATSAVSINGGGSLTFANYTSAVTTTLASLTFNNAGGAANPTVALGTPTAGNSHTLIISGASPITSTNDSLATTPTISTGSATLTGLQFSDANPVITVNSGLAETGLTISAPITQHASMTSLSKSGTGVLALSGASTFNTGFNLNQGSLMFGVNSTGTLPTVTNGPVGTGTLTIAGGTSLLSDGTIRTIGNATTVNGDFTFAGPVAGSGVILSGAMNLGAAGRTINVDSPANTSTISGAITSTATGTALTKSGAGTLLLSSASSNFGGAGVAVTGGILRNGIINAIPTASAVAVSAGAGYDLNGFAQTVDGISGAGFVTNSANSAQTLTVSSTVTNSTFAGSLTDNILGQGASRLNLAKSGAGTSLTLSGINNYAGTTTVNAGTIQFAKQASLYNNTPASWTAANINVKSGATLALNVGGTDEFTPGNVTTLLSNLAASSSATNGMNAGAILGFDTSNAAGGTFTVSDVIANTTGASGGSRSLSKQGNGTLVLTAANTYTGTSEITGGQLQVTGALSGGGNVSVSGSGTTLAGSGSIAGSTTISSGSILTPGVGADLDNSNQTLSFTGSGTSLTVNDGGRIRLGITSETFLDTAFTSGLGGTYANAASYLIANPSMLASWNANAGDRDFINATGNVSLGSGGGTITVFTTGAFTPVNGQVFNLMDWAGLIGTFNPSTTDLTLPDLSGLSLSWDTSAFASHGVIVSVPEPSRAILLLLGLLGLMLRRRRR